MKDTVELLKRHFDIAVETKDGIKKLRELILTLGMQGKLVEQDPNDQPAIELLKEIEAEKKRLVEEGKIKAGKELPEIKAEEVPYEVPKGWTWTKLGGIAQKIHYGYTASADHNIFDVRLLRITDIQDDKVNWATVPGCQIDKDQVQQYILANNDLLIARTGGTIGKTYLVENINLCAVFASYLIRVVPSSKINAQFVKQFTLSALYWQQLYEKSMGTGQPNVNGVSLSNLFIPLPPLAEQKRIVAKIDQLMALCDKLEAERNERNQKRVTVHTASMNRLLSAKDKPAFNSSWQFIRKNFNELYSVTENVDELKKAILQLAVMGKLVPQDPNDQPASELLKEIEAEKKRLVDEGKIKAGKPLPEIKAGEVPYEMPEGWVWVRLGELFRVSSGDGLTKDKMRNGNIPVFGGNGITGYHDSHNVEKPTIVIGRVGFYCGSIHLTPEKAWITDNAFITTYDEKRLYQSYVIWLLKTINLQVDTSSTAQPVISGSKIYPILIPIPPIAEQKRIVAKIDQLMKLCDELAQQMQAGAEKQTDILDAVLARA